VGDHDHGLPVLVDRPPDLVQQLGRRPGVEVAGGLVREDQVGPGDQRPRRGDPLLLAAGKLGGAVTEAVGDAERAGQFPEPAAGRLLAAQGQRQQDVLPRGQGGDEVEGLEHETDALAAQ